MTLFETMDREGRFGEWMAALALLAIGIVLALPGDTMRFSEWWALRDFGVREVMVGVATSALGAARMVVLWINGSWHRTPLLRGIGATCGMIIFAFMALASAWSWAVGDVKAPDMNFAFYAIFALADMRGVHRAGRDADHAKLAA